MTWPSLVATMHQISREEQGHQLHGAPPIHPGPPGPPRPRGRRHRLPSNSETPLHLGFLLVLYMFC